VSTRGVIEAFEAWRAGEQRLALATVVGTEGSTYTKAGHRIIINGDGGYQGLVSGGCLEGDLAEHARAVIATGESRLLTYDLRDEADELFGLGIGCNGMFRILLQGLTPQSGYEPYASIVRCSLGTDLAAVATVVESADPETAAGATLIRSGDDLQAFGIPHELVREVGGGCAELLERRQPEMRSHLCHGHALRVLYAPLWPLPRLLILGGGLDAVPMVSMAARLGWRVTVVDRRPASLARGDLTEAENLLAVVPAEIARRVSLPQFAAAIVMSHHLDTDRAYLRELAASPIAYIGLLGPQSRRDRLLTDLGPAAEKLGGRLRAPVGLEIGADSPESIALAALAEIQMELARLRSPAPVAT
jgi:xanthine/CO dehydrogenase XdhC/CoxF family maturation factor